MLLADALDAALACHGGPDDLAMRRDWAARLADAAAHLADRDARLQAHLWALTVAWEVLDLPRMHRSMYDLDLLAAESPKAEFFAATRRLPLELLRHHLEVAPALVERATNAAAQAVIPDADGIVHAMRGYTAFLAGDPEGCAAQAPAFEHHGVEFGVAAVRAEAAVIWLGARRLDKVAEMIAAFTPDVLSGLPLDTDWLLTLQCVLEGALAVGDRGVTTAVLALLSPYAGRSVVNGGRGHVARRHRRHPGPGPRCARGCCGLGPPPVRRSGDLRAHRRALVAGSATGASCRRNRRSRPMPSPSICMKRPAGCGSSGGKGRRSCCPACVGWATCTHCSADRTPICPR